MQRGRQPSRLNQHMLCPQLMSEENNKRRLTPPCGKRQTHRGVDGEEASCRSKRKERRRISCQLGASGHALSSHLYQTCQQLRVYLLAAGGDGGGA